MHYNPLWICLWYLMNTTVGSLRVGRSVQLCIVYTVQSECHLSLVGFWLKKKGWHVETIKQYVATVPGLPPLQIIATVGCTLMTACTTYMMKPWSTYIWSSVQLIYIAHCSGEHSHTTPEFLNNQLSIWKSQPESHHEDDNRPTRLCCSPFLVWYVWCSFCWV